MKDKLAYMTDLVKLAVPSFGSMLVGCSMFTVDLYFASSSNNVNMISGVGLGTMIMNLFGLQTFIGLNGAIETLVPQYVSNREYFMTGVILQRGRFSILCVLLPILMLLTRIEPMLIFMGQDAKVAKYAQIYSLISFPKYAFYGLFDCQRRWLNCFQLNHVPLTCQVVGLCLHVIMCYVFVIIYDCGIVGLGVSGTIAFLTALVGTIFYQNFLEDMDETNVGFFDNRVYDISGLHQQLMIALPSCLVLYMNFWIWELMILLSGFISVDDQAAQIFIMNIVAQSMNTAYGLQQATSTLMGQQIGRMDIDAAYMYQYSSYKIAFLVNIMIVIFFSCFVPILMQLYTNVEGVIQKVDYSTLMPCMIGISCFWDHMKINQNGMVKALGLQKQAIKISFVGNWPICFTLLFITCFYLKIGLIGIWVSKFIADVYLVVRNHFLVQFDRERWQQIATQFQEKRRQQVQMSNQIQMSYVQDGDSFQRI